MAKNSNKPSIRFKGFTDAWEQRKLKEVVDVYDGVHQTPDYTDNGIMFLSVENISTLKSEKYISEAAFNRDYKVYPEKGDILMTRIGDVGTPNVVETNEKVAFYVSLALLKPINVDPYFLCNSILSPFFQNGLKKRTLVTAIPQKINKDEIGKVSLYLPNLIDEQKKIGAFFRRLDNLITLHQRKYEKFVNIKKALLEKMFPQGDAKVPRIRFKGFTDAWEQRKLGEISEKMIEKNRDHKYSETFTNSAEFGIVRQMEYFDHAISKIESIGGYYVVHPNDFVYNPRISVLAPVGPINRNKLQKIGVMSPLYTVFRAHAIHPQYLEFYFKSDVWHAYMRFNGDSGARSDRFSIKTELFFDMPIPCPQFEEQEKIGKLLERVDNLITLHQRQVEKLKNIKSALLEKMFV